MYRWVGWVRGRRYSGNASRPGPDALLPFFCIFAQTHFAEVRLTVKVPVLLDHEGGHLHGLGGWKSGWGRAANGICGAHPAHQTARLRVQAALLSGNGSVKTSCWHCCPPAACCPCPASCER